MAQLFYSSLSMLGPPARFCLCSALGKSLDILCEKKNLITLFVQVPADLHNVRCLNTVGVFNFVP